MIKPCNLNKIMDDKVYILCNENNKKLYHLRSK